MTHQGIITLYNRAKAWGFITENSAGESRFFHYSNCVPGFSPQLGDAVAFEIAPPISLGKKDQAVNVRVLNRAETVAAMLSLGSAQ